MQRRQVLFGVLGVALAASAVQADIPKEATLFGQKYNITVTKRTGTFKNGVVIKPATPTADGDETEAPGKANLAFAPGGTPDADRLFVVSAFQDQDDVEGDQLYVLKGSSPEGVFSPEVSEAEQFFGGFVTKNQGGRPQTIAFINDVDTGPKKDRNLAVLTYTGDDKLRFFDLDSLKAGFEEDTLLGITRPDVLGDDEDDPFMPGTGPLALAVTPDRKNLLVAGLQDGELSIGMIGVTEDKFYPVRTLLSEAVTDAPDTFDPYFGRPHALAHITGNEYWMIVSDPDPNAPTADTESENYLYRLEITPPADPTQEGQIQVKVTGVENLRELNLGGDTRGIFGLATGREVAPGEPVIYMADWAENLLTLIPDVPPPAAGQ